MFNGPNGVGKGDKPRGMNISRKEFEKRWEKIFGHKGLNKDIFKEDGKEENKSNKKNN